MEVDGQSYKSWAWWLDALQVMRRTYSIPMDAKEARIRADVEEEKSKESAAALRSEAAEAMMKGQLMRWIGKRKDPELLRAVAEEARRMDRLKDELMAVNKWAMTKDPKVAKYRKQLGDEQMKMHLRRMTEERSVGKEEPSDDDP